MGKIAFEDKVKRLSSGNVNNLSDFLLLTTIFGLETFGAVATPRMRTARGVYQLFEDLDDVPDSAKRDYEELRRFYYRLRQKGLVNYAKHSLTSIEITARGQRKLADLFVRYQKKRPWDGNIYVITYDIPEKKRRTRDQLRLVLKKTNCVQLHKSVWITPYNPHRLLGDFAKRNHVRDCIIISDLATDDGVVGEETISQLIERIYHLYSINESYKRLAQKMRLKTAVPMDLYLEYVGILRDDPQLPFPLLPDYWQGDVVYHQLKKLVPNSLKF